MNEQPADFAATVETASGHAVDGGAVEGVVNPPQKSQLFMAFSDVADLGQDRKTRETALLVKFLGAGRLSKEERDEIGHIIGQPEEARSGKAVPLVIGATVPVPTLQGRGADDYEHLGIKRRTYFRWLNFGKQLPDGPDLPPFDEPHLLPAWYERMRQRGIFKHRFPAEVADAIEALSSGGQVAAKVAPKTPVEATQATVPEDAGSVQRQVPASFGADHGLASGLQYEVQAEQQRVAALRVARDEAYQKKQKDDGDAFDRRYREALDALSLVQQRAIKIGEQEGRLVPIEIIEQEFAPRLAAVVQGGLLLWDSVGPAIMECPDHAARRTLWKKLWIEFCTGLRTDRFRFAPPLELT